MSVAGPRGKGERTDRLIKKEREKNREKKKEKEERKKLALNIQTQQTRYTGVLEERGIGVEGW